MSAITKAIGDQTARNFFAERIKTTTAVLTEAELATIIETTVEHTLDAASKVADHHSVSAGNAIRELFHNGSRTMDLAPTTTDRFGGSGDTP
jgi:hypothetical protein